MTILRSAWTTLTDPQLLAQCAVDTYRASGPGGQKRNKTDSAVRLRHLPSGLIVIAEESRSQHENKARALRRLRERLHVQLREPVSQGPTEQTPRLNVNLKVGRREERFWPTVGFVLDILSAVEGQVSTAAEQLGVSTGQLIDFLQREEVIWAQANQIRQRNGHKPLRNM